MPFNARSNEDINSKDSSMVFRHFFLQCYQVYSKCTSNE